MTDVWHFSGYHGTSLSTARSIEKDGFGDFGYPICFAPLDNMGFAQQHGRRRSIESGEPQFGIVQAMFPPQKVELGLGGDQIQVPVTAVGQISIQQVLVFETHPNGLYLPAKIEN